MRRIAVIAAIAASVVLALAAVAHARNLYRVTLAGVSPTQAGTTASPQPIRLNFGFQVTTDDGNRPAPSSDYLIAFGSGIKQNRTFFRRCTNAQAGFNAGAQANCPANSLVGQGRVSNLLGPTANPAAKIPCNLRLRVYNGDGGYAAAANNDGRRVRADVWLVLNGGPNDPAISRCPAAIPPIAIPAQFVRHLGGLGLSFHVPKRPLREPQAGVSNAVVEVSSSLFKTVRRPTRVGGRTVMRTRGFFETTRCPAGGHPVNVRFTDESGLVSNAPTRRAPCRRPS